MTKALFVTGTNTDVGKTYITGLILKKLKEYIPHPAYYKGAMSGNERTEDGTLIPGDAKLVRNMAGLTQPLSAMCPYIYETAVSPHLASRMEGNPVNLDVVKKGFYALTKDYSYITMEGSGGICCPLNYPLPILFLEDVIKSLNLTSLLVADAGLGTINHVLLTVNYMESRGLPLAGIIYNNYHPGNVMEEDNILMCETLTKLPTIAKVQPGDTTLDISAEKLAAYFKEVSL